MVRRNRWPRPRFPLSADPDSPMTCVTAVTFWLAPRIWCTGTIVAGEPPNSGKS
jgi:hypothetical protein